MVWFKTCKKLHLVRHSRILKWLAYDSSFLPSSLDKQFKQWVHKGITAYCSITNGCILESFSRLSNVFDLEKFDFFRYLQVRDYFNGEIKHRAESESKLINIFSEAYKAKGSKHLISRIYKELQNSKDQSTDHVRQKWEKESGLEIT